MPSKEPWHRQQGGLVPGQVRCRALRRSLGSRPSHRDVGLRVAVPALGALTDEHRVAGGSDPAPAAVCVGPTRVRGRTASRPRLVPPRQV